MQFQPKTEKEIEEENLWPAGEYSFEILQASEEVSKNGNDMIKLKVGITNDEGHTRYIYDYLMEAMAYKLRHAAYACGLGDDYESGQLDPCDFVHKTGQAKVIIQKDKTGNYPDKNTIADYIVSDDYQAQANGKSDSAPLDDSILF